MKRTKLLWILFTLMLVVAPILASCAPAATSVPPAVKETAVKAETAVEKAETPVVKETAEEIVEVKVTPVPAKDLEGTIVISFGGSDTQTWENLAKAYMALHPKVTVRVELKPAEGYAEWINAQFATGKPEISLVAANQNADLLNAKKFLDLAPYLDKISPYSGKPWRDDMDEGAIRNMTDPIEGRINVLNLETVQVLWFYNKDIFAKVGITDVPQQPTWSQFIGWCQKIKDAGYIPLALEGNATSFWSMRVGWLMRMYIDQYTRSEAELVRCQTGDYCFRAGIDDKWTYNPADPHNDDNNMVTFNVVRKMIALRDHTQSVDNPQWKAMYENFSQLLGPMTEPGWIGVTDALPLFLTQKAAIWLDGAWFFTSFEKNIKQLAEGSYGTVGEGTPTPTAVPGAAQATVFNLGTFNNPSMEGPLVQAKARTIEVNIGFWGIPKKDQAQNDLEVDFLMFVTSPQGYGIYLRNKLDPNNLQGGINGPPIVKNVVLPSPYKERFANVNLIGNNEKDTAGGYRSRGVNDYQPMVREWVDLSQQYFQGTITIDAFLKAYQASIDTNFNAMVTDFLRWKGGLSALDTPEKKPEILE